MQNQFKKTIDEESGEIGSHNLPEGLEKFHSEKLNSDHLKAHIKANLNLLLIRNKDFEWRVKNRGKFGWSILAFLVAQVLAIFSLIFHAYSYDKLKEIQFLFGTIFTVLVIQNYLTLNFLIKWLFSEIPYNKNS